MGVELGEGRREVGLHRALGEEELVGDLTVGEAEDHEAEDLLLAIGERARSDLTYERAWHRQLTGEHGVARSHQRAVEVGVEHESRRSAQQRAAQRGVGGVSRHGGHDRSLGVGLGHGAQVADALGRLPAAEQDDERVGLLADRRVQVIVGVGREAAGGQKLGRVASGARVAAEDRRHRRGPRAEGGPGVAAFMSEQRSGRPSGLRRAQVASAA